MFVKIVLILNYIFQVKHEAKLGLNILDNESPNRIFLLFMKKISPIEKFEYLIQ